MVLERVSLKVFIKRSLTQLVFDFSPVHSYLYLEEVVDLLICRRSFVFC